MPKHRGASARLYGIQYDPGMAKSPAPQKKQKPIKLDDADWKIINLLQVEGRATYARLAEEAGISTASAHDRVRKLEQRGVIQGYMALVSPRAVGAEVTALLQSVKEVAQRIPMPEKD